MLNLALNHSVIIDRETGEYNAASPDEMALVNFAKQYHFEYLGESDGVTKVRIGEGEDNILEVTKLADCEFTSTRKRASTIYQVGDRILLFTKGADSIIEALLGDTETEYKQVAQEKVDSASEIGLRTLFLAYKEIDEDTYNDWKARHDEAKASIIDRDLKVQEVNNEIEVDLVLHGSTAIEDRLQDDVPDTIAFARAAGIKVWVLTGDKTGTAINIGYSCRLLEQNGRMDVHKIESVDRVETANKFSELEELIRGGTYYSLGEDRELAVVITG